MHNALQIRRGLAWALGVLAVLAGFSPAAAAADTQIRSAARTGQSGHAGQTSQPTSGSSTARAEAPRAVLSNPKTSTERRGSDHGPHGVLAAESPPELSVDSAPATARSPRVTQQSRTEHSGRAPPSGSRA